MGLVIIPAASMIISLITTPEVKEEIARKGISFLGKWLWLSPNKDSFFLREIYTSFYGNQYYILKGEWIMTYKQIEASREVRLWLSQIVIPAASVAVTLLAIPEVRQAIGTKVTNVKESIQNKIRRRKSH